MGFGAVGEVLPEAGANRRGGVDAADVASVCALSFGVEAGDGKYSEASGGAADVFAVSSVERVD